MDIEEPEAQSLKQKAEALQRLSTGSLSSSVSKLSYSSRSIPVDRDFHFYYNFDEFKVPVKEISDKTQLLLERVGTSSRVWGKRLALPDDLDDAYDWLVNANDEIFERFDVSLDEFQSSRKREEEGSSMPAESCDGFQLVYGKKKKKGFVDARNAVGLDSSARTSVSAGDAGMKVTLKDTRVVTGVKSRVPFHIPTIPRPQDVFKILVNNSNQPFQHVWLQRSEDDGETLVHPLEEHSVSDFVDRNIESMVPVEPPSLECTPFKLVEEVKDLKELASKLRAANEFAVDLEHNQYRTFQGMTCLMQVSTRSEDFIVDTLKLRIHVGPHLREVFKDPSKRKVMHGADRDILWLQRDFGIYVCNLFDTGQASRVLKLERNSLEHLLSHFCGVTADKEYQNADWRLRPLPYEMLKYAREDTHYLLYIYDLMRIRLLSASTESEYSDNLLEVYKRSSDICMQLYEKELLTETSYLHIYGLQESDFNAQQLAIVAGLCEWRDVIARTEDESTGYILPNRTLLEIAKQMPGTTSKLRRLLKSKHPYVERNLASVVSIIQHSVLHASAFEAAAEELKAHRLERASGENMGTDGSEATQSETSINLKANAGAENSGANKINSSVSAADPASSQVRNGPMELEGSEAEVNRDGKRCSSVLPGEKEVKMDISSGQARDVITETSVPTSTKVTGAAVRLLKKPSSAFGALLGNSVSKKNSDVDTKGMKQMKLEQIKSTVNLPFYSFSGNERTKPVAKESTEVPKSFHKDDPAETASSGLEDIILLDANTGTEHPRVDDSNGVNEILESEEKKTVGPESDVEPMSLSDLSSSFQECFQSINKNKTSKQVKSFQESNGLLQLKPFDYEVARKEIRFGEGGEKKLGEDCNEDGRGGHMKQGVGVGQRKKNGGATELAQGKRRQAFPASGNRSVTFR